MARVLVSQIKDNRKNAIINGDMRIAQRGTSFVSPANAAYMLDRFRYEKVTTAATHTVTQDTDVPTFAQAGYLFQNSLRYNLTTPDDTIGAGDVHYIEQRIEGYNFVNLAQKPFTLSFWVKATLAGTYAIAFRNTTPDRSYVAEYTISASNTWEYKTITVAASPSAGTWNYTNGIGLRVAWVLASGSSNNTTPGSWQTGNFTGTSNIVNGVQTGATDFRITGAIINEGYEALAFRTFGEDFARELAACQRYLRLIDSATFVANTTTTIEGYNAWQEMRDTPVASALGGNLVIEDPNVSIFTQSSPHAALIVPRSNKGGKLQLQNFTGLTDGGVYFMTPTNTRNIMLDSEL